MHLLTLNIYLFLFLCIIYILLTPIILIKLKKKFLIYLNLMIYVTLLIFGLLTSVTIKNNEITFKLLINKQWIASSFSISFINLTSIMINLFLLFPLGSFLPLIISNKSKFLFKIVIIGIVTSILIEILQFALPINRSCEVLDVITNTISSLLGYIYYLFLNKLIFRGEKDD